MTLKSYRNCRSNENPRHWYNPVPGYYHIHCRFASGQQNRISTQAVHSNRASLRERTNAVMVITLVIGNQFHQRFFALKILESEASFFKIKSHVLDEKIVSFEHNIIYIVVFSCNSNLEFICTIIMIVTINDAFLIILPDCILSAIVLDSSKVSAIS